jgi:AhpD family alkylhydroperoxidase
MATVSPPPDPESDPRVRAVFDDIRATRGSDFVNNVWRWLAFDPALLEETWRDVKAVMATESALDAKTKEMIYAAVSIVNACDYCTHSHLAAARAKGMTSAEQADLMRVVAMAARTNALLNAIRPPVDAAFLAPGPDSAPQSAPG